MMTFSLFQNLVHFIFLLIKTLPYISNCCAS